MSFEPQKVRAAFSLWWYVHVRRFWFNLTHLHSNPWSPSGRRPREDFGHSYVNLYVELVRTSAYLVGHVLAVAVPLLLLNAVWRVFA